MARRAPSLRRSWLLAAALVVLAVAGGREAGVAAPAPPDSAAGATALAAPAAPDSAASPPARGRSPLPVEVHLQFGWLMRGGGTAVRWEKANYLVTGDLLVLRRTNRPLTWGLGLRVVGDDDGGRYGLSGVLRGHFEPKSHVYWQVAPGVAFAGSDNHRELRLPAGYLTAELGDDRWLAVCGAVEVVPYRHWRMGFREVPDPWGGSDEEAVWDEAGTEVSWYLGGKAQRWVGASLFLILIIGVGASMSHDSM